MFAGREAEHMVAMATRGLRRMEEEGWVRSSRRHRMGESRRLKVVTLKMTRYT